jgi:hypothetical protein
MANGRRPNLFDSRLSSRFFNPRANELYMDTSLLNYAPQDTFNYNRIDPASLQMQSVDQLPYDPSTLQTVYQSLPPVQGPQPFVGPPSPSLNMDSGTLGASIYSAQDFDTEEEMMLAGAESLGWKEKGENPIVAQATQSPISNVPTGNTSLQGPNVDTALGRNAGANVDVNQFISADVLDEMQNISSVPAGTMAASDLPSLPEDITGMSFEEFMTPSISGEELMNNPAYSLQNQSGVTSQGYLTDVSANQFADTASQTGALSKVSGAMDAVGGATNILGAGMMVGGNLAAMGQYGDAIGDVEEGLAEIPGMLSETLTSAQRETENVRDILTSQVESTADASNTRLQQSLNQLTSNPQQAVGNVQSKSNEIRRNLAEGIDMALANASERFDMQSERIQEGKRESVDAIETIKAELKAKKKELEKEKEQAKWGAVVGVGSLVADAFLPGSGQILRSGYSQYASRT